MFFENSYQDAFDQLLAVTLVLRHAGFSRIWKDLQGSARIKVFWLKIKFSVTFLMLVCLNLHNWMMVCLILDNSMLVSLIFHSSMLECLILDNFLLVYLILNDSMVNNLILKSSMVDDAMSDNSLAVNFTILML